MMIDRVKRRFAIKRGSLIGDIASGAAELLRWMVSDKAIEPHVPVWDKTQHEGGTPSSSDFQRDESVSERTVREKAEALNV